MSYFDDASLVMIPSGYKDQKVYSVKPLDGSGDLTFSRASSATRVASNGLIEKVRSNRFTYSQALANAAWATLTNGGAITKTANAGTAPDGTNTATRIQIGGGGTYSLVYQSGVNPLGLVVISGYFKRYGSTNQTFRLFGNNGSALSGTLTATDTWQRFSYVMTAASTGADGIAADASNNAYDILVWGMQIESGDVATDYIATTSAAVSVGPVSGLPRLDYLNSTCPRLLLEPQRTNTITYSEDINNAFSSKVGVTITSNNTASPDGYVSADLLKFDTTSAYILRSQTVAAATTYTMSVFVKNNNFTSGQNLTFNMSDGVIGGLTAQINVVAKTATYSGATGAYTNVSGKVEDYGNGWFRVSVTGTSVSGGSGWYEMAAAGITNSVYVWGFSLEIGAYATSYIPTLGTSVTRVADAASKTSASALIGQTEGVMFVDFQFNGTYDSNGIVAMNVLAAGGNEAYIFITGLGQLRLELYVAGALQAAILTSIGSVGRKKIAFAYKANDFVGYMNGVQIGTDTSGTVGAMSTIYVGTYQSAGYANGNINQALLFKTRLSNSDLATLTTL